MNSSLPITIVKGIKGIKMIRQMTGLFKMSLGLSLICLMSCNKLYDERDEIIGNYDGIKIFSRYARIDTLYFIERDTTAIQISLLKSMDESTVQVIFNPNISNREYFFKYSKKTFQSTIELYPPDLKISADSLLFYETSNISPPQWLICFAKKVK